MPVVVPDGREGRLKNARIKSGYGVVQFLGTDGVFYDESFRLEDIKEAD